MKKFKSRICKNEFRLLLSFLLIISLPILTIAQSDDPDLPDFAKYKIDKETFMTLRAEAIGMKRGIVPGQFFDPQERMGAVMQLQNQEAMQTARKLARFNGAQNRVTAATWIPLGPAPIPNGQTTPTAAVSGRTISIAVHPTNPNIVYAGTAQGGLYRTINGGTTWKPIFDNALSLAVGAITISPSDPETLYVGTGEPNFSSDSYFGVGIYRITNASTTATLSGPLNLNSTGNDIFSGRSISKIICVPTNPDIIFVASASGVGGIINANSVFPSRGVYRCINATSATPVFEKLTGLIGNLNVSVRDLAIDPSDPNILIVNPIATGINQGGIYRSVNALAASPAAVTFTQQVVANSTSTSNLTAEFAAIHPAGNSNATFYAATGFSGSGRVYRSTDGGVTWTIMITNAFCGGQCFYDIAIAVDPTNVNRVYLGGDPTIAGATSIDGGATFIDSKTGVHSDSHVITVSPSDPTQVWLGTDGGIYKSITSGALWVNQNTSQYSATQFMSLALHPTDPNFSIGGTQDNGTNFYKPDGTWTRTDYGDGGYAQIDQNATDATNVRMYHTYYNASGLQGYATVSSTVGAFENWAFRGCQSSGATTNGITCNSSTAINFYAPLERGPGNPNTIYYGSDRLYRSSDNGTNHTVVSQNPIVSGVAISAIGISQQNDNVRIVGLNNGALYGTSTGSTTLSDLDASNIIPNVSIARTIVDPNSQTIAYVTLSAFGQNSVWKTTNLNNAAPTWIAASTGLPQIPVNSFVVSPTSSNILYAGTDIGVYYSINSGGTWAPVGTGLPRVAVFGLGISANNKLRAATHGRGLWEIDINSVLPINIESFTATAQEKGKALLQWTTATEYNNKGFEIERSIFSANSSYLKFEKVGFVLSRGNSTNPVNYTYIDEPFGGRKFVYRLRQVDLDADFSFSDSRTVTFIGNNTSLFAANPNPAINATTIKYELADAGIVEMSLYNVSGQKIRQLFSKKQEAGVYQYILNTQNLAGGTYFYRLNTAGFTQSQKLVVTPH